MPRNWNVPRTIVTTNPYFRRIDSDARWWSDSRSHIIIFFNCSYVLPGWGMVGAVHMGSHDLMFFFLIPSWPGCFGLPSKNLLIKLINLFLVILSIKLRLILPLIFVFIHLFNLPLSNYLLHYLSLLLDILLLWLFLL